jgi:hypothetical protein
VAASTRPHLRDEPRPPPRAPACTPTPKLSPHRSPPPAARPAPARCPRLSAAPASQPPPAAPARRDARGPSDSQILTGVLTATMQSPSKAGPGTRLRNGLTPKRTPASTAPSDRFSQPARRVTRVMWS